jgi:hypothetical protein
MYAVFFHVSAIALLEIIFYFYYVGPMETRVFTKSLSNVIDENTKNNIIQPYLNSNNIYLKQFQKNITNYYDPLIDKEREERNKDNYDLYLYSIKYWTILLAASIFVFLLHILYYYYVNKEEIIKKSNSVSGFSIEMIETNENNNNNYEQMQIRSSDIELNENKKYKKTIMKSFCHLFILIALILGFEYWFFNDIVLKYKIIDNKEIEYIIIKQFF